MEETFKPLTSGLPVDMAKSEATGELRLSKITRPCHRIRLSNILDVNATIVRNCQLLIRSGFHKLDCFAHGVRPGELTLMGRLTRFRDTNRGGFVCRGKVAPEPLDHSVTRSKHEVDPNRWTVFGVG